MRRTRAGHTHSVHTPVRPVHSFQSFLAFLVRYRAFVSSPSFKALNSSITIDVKVNKALLGGGGCPCLSVTCVFQNPDGVVVKQISRTRAIDGIYADTFPLSEIVK